MSWHCYRARGWKSQTVNFQENWTGVIFKMKNLVKVTFWENQSAIFKMKSPVTQSVQSLMCEELFAIYSWPALVTHTPVLILSLLLLLIISIKIIIILLCLLIFLLILFSSSPSPSYHQLAVQFHQMDGLDGGNNWLQCILWQAGVGRFPNKFHNSTENWMHRIAAFSLPS